MSSPLNNEEMDSDKKHLIILGMCLATAISVTWLVAWCVVRVTESKAKASPQINFPIVPRQ